MRLERLTYNKIKFFITCDDLFDRGLSKEDLGRESLKWNQLFQDMIEEANEQFGVEIQGTVAVEVFSLKAQGMVMIITVEEVEEEIFNEVFIDMQVLGSSDDIIFEFYNIEDVIQLCKRLKSMKLNGGSLYAMNKKYFLVFEGIDSSEQNNMVSVLAEYGEHSLCSIHRIKEYGQLIIKKNTVETISTYFS